MRSPIKYLYSSFLFLLQPDPELENTLRDFCGHVSEPPDMKFFHPLHSQLELESSHVHDPMAITANLSNDQDGMQFENCTPAVDVTNFLDSVLLSSDEHSSEDYHINMISTVETESLEYVNMISTVQSESPKYINALERVYVEDSNLCRESGVQVAQGQVFGNISPPRCLQDFYLSASSPLNVELCMCRSKP